MKLEQVATYKGVPISICKEPGHPHFMQFCVEGTPLGLKPSYKTFSVLKNHIDKIITNDLVSAKNKRVAFKFYDEKLGDVYQVGSITGKAFGKHNTMFQVVAEETGKEYFIRNDDIYVENIDQIIEQSSKYIELSKQYEDLSESFWKLTRSSSLFNYLKSQNKYL